MIFVLTYSGKNFDFFFTVVRIILKRFLASLRNDSFVEVFVLYRDGFAALPQNHPYITPIQTLLTVILNEMK